MMEINIFGLFNLFTPINKSAFDISSSNLSAKQFNMHSNLIRLLRKYVMRRKTIENIINLNAWLMAM